MRKLFNRFRNAIEDVLSNNLKMASTLLAIIIIIDIINGILWLINVGLEELLIILQNNVVI